MTKEQLADAIRVTDDASLELLDCLRHYRKERLGSEQDRDTLAQAHALLVRESRDMTRQLDLLLGKER